MSLPPDLVVRRADVLWRRSIDCLLLRRPGAPELVKLTGSGRALWDALETPVTFGGLCARLAAGHDADEATIIDELSPVVQDLVERGVMAVA